MDIYCRHVGLFALLFFPTCLCLQLTYRVKEDTGQGDYIGNIPQELNFPSLAPSQKQRNYQVLAGGDKITVDPVLGDLNTAIRLDREKLCPYNPPTCVIDVEVAVLPSTYFDLIKVQIFIEDLNDNAPKFPSDVLIKDISESAFIGTIIRLDSATDPDLGLNAIHGYELEVSTLNSGETTNPFQLVVTENIDGTKIPQLQLSETLDREVTSSYELLLKAIDGGTPRLTGTATIEITVTDSNDNQPTFPRGSYVVEVPEDRPEGFMVIQVQATDLDSGTNADLTYSFPSLVSAHDKAIFRLDPDSGEISIKAPGLDYENRTIHHLTVEARDKGPNSSPAYTTVTVQVVDVNDEYPQIVINFMDYLDTASQDDTPSEATGTSNSGTASVLIKEDMAKGTYIAFVTITDRDTGVNGNVTCRLKDSKDFELYELDKKESRYLIKTNKTLDRETKPFYNLKIEAWDFGSPSLTNTTIIAVELEDVNDNPPTFRQPSYTVGVGELIRNGRKVTQIKATDEDDGLNARITYTIQPVNENENLPFNIEQDTGIVRFGPNAEPLDADISTKAFLMTVTATDNGTPPLSATVSLTITVNDENDNTPVFTEAQYSFLVKEHLQRGAYIGYVLANDSDADTLTNAKVTYSFVDSNENIPFSINPDTGKISYDGEQSAMDREVLQSQPYILRVKARDEGKEPRQNFATVQIYLIDINDNPPSVSFPNVTRDVAFVYIKKNLRSKNKGRNQIDGLNSPLQSYVRIGHSASSAVKSPASSPVIITHVAASDPDDNENGRVRFAMAAGNIYNYFAINMSTGDVTLNIKNVGELKTIKKGCHVLEILVSDMGKPKVLSTTTWVNIYITDEKPRNMNATNALKACMNNTFYPILHMKDLNMGKAGADELAFILIICFATLLLLVIVIMIVMLVKYKCCCTKRKMSRSYNCQKANNLYPDEIYQPSLSIEKQPGSQTSLSHTAWSAEQMVEENKNLNGHDELSEGGSVVSHYTGKDSGTGDSMPSDAHNPPYYRVMYNARNELYPPHQLPMPSQSTVNQADKPIYSVGNQSLRSRSSNSFTSRCTNECHVRGHGDNCWMPDTMHHHQDYMDHVPRPTIQYVEHPNYHTAIPCPMHGENCNSLACLQNNYGQDSNYGNQYQAMNPELNLPHHMPLNMEYDAYPNHTYGVEQRNIEKAYVNLQQRSSIAMAVDNEHSYPPYQYDYMDNGDTGLLSPLDYNDDEYMLDQPSHVAIPPQLNQRTEEGFKSNDGLSTIKEELDAEEVVAEIDHLLQ